MVRCVGKEDAAHRQLCHTLAARPTPLPKTLRRSMPVSKFKFSTFRFLKWDAKYSGII